LRLWPPQRESRRKIRCFADADAVCARTTHSTVCVTQATHTHTQRSLRHTHTHTHSLRLRAFAAQRGTHYTHSITILVNRTYPSLQTLRALCRRCTGQVMPVQWRKASSKSRVLSCCVLHSVCVRNDLCASARNACRCMSSGGSMRACSRSSKASKEARVSRSSKASSGSAHVVMPRAPAGRMHAPLQRPHEVSK
jgi:hypothetical protein